MNLAIGVSGAASCAPAFAVRGLRASYAGRQVLGDQVLGDQVLGNQALGGVDLELAAGEVLCLIGHNGAGKSTLLKVLFGLHPADAGTIQLRGTSLTPDPGRMARDGVAYVPEGRGVFPGLTVKEIFTLALWSAGLGRGEGNARTGEVLDLLPRLKDFWSRRAGQLSGGEQQMVSLGRALLSRPGILLLDEPSIGLAPQLFRDLLAPIRAIQQQRGMSILLVEQNVGEAFAISDRVVAMKSGAVIYQGRPADLADHARLLTLF
jgi:ABC-type branched-subunit amino acid transport system ATPase component